MPNLLDISEKKISESYQGLVQIDDGKLFDALGNFITDLEALPPIGSVRTQYHHIQSGASAEWTVNHDLGRVPTVVVVDSAGEVVFGDVTHVGLNQSVLRFSVPFAGDAFCS